MKVNELIEQLKELPGDYEIVMSSDGEGNNHSPLADFSVELYSPDSTWSGEIKHEEDMDRGEEWIPNSIVLWPTN